MDFLEGSTLEQRRPSGKPNFKTWFVLSGRKPTAGSSVTRLPSTCVPPSDGKAIASFRVKSKRDEATERTQEHSRPEASSRRIISSGRQTPGVSVFRAAASLSTLEEKSAQPALPADRRRLSLSQIKKGRRPARALAPAAAQNGPQQSTLYTEMSGRGEDEAAFRQAALQQSLTHEDLFFREKAKFSAFLKDPVLNSLLVQHREPELHASEDQKLAHLASLELDQRRKRRLEQAYLTLARRPVGRADQTQNFVLKVDPRQSSTVFTREAAKRDLLRKSRRLFKSVGRPHVAPHD